MKKNYKVLLFIIFGLQNAEIQAQQDAQYTQYMYNTLSVNPGYTGTRDILSIVGLHRSQWVGVDGAPVTQTIAAHAPLGKSNIGVGFSAINDKIGPTQETSLDLDVSYGIETSYRSKLSFGLKVGGNLLDANFDEINFSRSKAEDPKFRNNIDNKFSPNIGLGVYYYSSKFYAGLSVPNLLETNHFDRNDFDSGFSSLAKEKINYYLMSGYTFEINYNVKFKPAVLGKFVAGAPLQIDVSGNFLIYNKLILGAAYRWNAAISGLAGFQVTEKILIGLAYDSDISEFRMANGNSGSFEIILRFELPKKQGRFLTPRFF